ncbi:MAG: transposase [Metallibacterium scheffleri]|jgi:REP element-mobilizing transposase RayT|uniref:transposase n=1 Tax=Metallibacterium scheffleri TaxID=993689 RepID=UPI0026ED7293|nr:transposase [Metallibacterium scheffleri]MCK9368093.1 transposase [Metallibacterium scheffleri]
MARPVRLEFGGALYHVTARGDRREAIYEDDADRKHFLEVLGQVIGQFNWCCHAYCLMGNHYHVVIATPDGNLSKGMRQLNGVFTQWSNRRHRRTGHLFQGRYKAILVDADNYLLELTRYVVLNPVRAHMVDAPAKWPWSSYQAVTGEVDAPAWLETDGLLAQFGTRRARAVAAYEKFVHEGMEGESIWKHLNRQVFLGNDAFVAGAHQRTGLRPDDINIPRAQRRPPAQPLDAIAKAHPDRDTAMRAAWATGEYSYTQIAAHFGVHFTTVGRIVRRAI